MQEDMIASNKDLYKLYCTRKDEATVFLNRLLHDDDFARQYFVEHGSIYFDLTIFGILPNKTTLLHHIVSLNDLITLKLIHEIMTKHLGKYRISHEVHDSLLFVSVSFNAYDCTEFLLKTKDMCDPNIIAKSLKYAVHGIDLRAVKMLLSYKYDRINPSLCFVILRKFLRIYPPTESREKMKMHRKIVSSLLKYGAFNVKFPESALTMATQSKHTVKVVKLLLEHGADPMNIVDNEIETPQIETPLSMTISSKRGYFGLMVKHIFKEKVECRKDAKTSCKRVMNALVLTLGDSFYRAHNIQKNILVVISMLKYVSDGCTCGEGKKYKPLVASHIPVIARYNTSHIISDLNILFMAGIIGEADRRANTIAKNYIDNFVHNVTLFDILLFDLELRDLQHHILS